MGLIVLAVAGWIFNNRKKASAPHNPERHTTFDDSTSDDPEMALQHPHWQVRLKAVRMIRQHQSPENLQLLITMLSDSDNDVREAAAEGILVYQQQALEGLAKTLQESVLHAREAALHILIRLNHPNSTPVLVNALLHDESAWVRIPAAQALGEISSQEAVEALGQALSDPHPDVVQTARSALERRGTAKARLLLKTQGKHDN
jgi:HEAT repeat protein